MKTNGSRRGETQQKRRKSEKQSRPSVQSNFLSCTKSRRQKKKKGVKQSVCLAAGSLQEADFSPAVVSPLLCLHSRLFLRLSNNPQYTSVFGRMRTVHVHFLSYSQTVFCSSLHVSRAEPAGVGLLSEPGPDAMQGECFEVLLICFFFLSLFQKPKVLQLQVLCLTQNILS